MLYSIQVKFRKIKFENGKEIVNDYKDFSDSLIGLDGTVIVKQGTGETNGRTSLALMTVVEPEVAATVETDNIEIINMIKEKEYAAASVHAA
ncbi:hypothetical protein [Candidatus Soleaferrea massiliensis]|uniref:hypothetical protein n=1 Tax=Candidatus Soleaferrea massiliensis TaxID=1470354 RepID=UPI00058BFD52|nr:hypothetical protein [Candidatus Soleaferrea massiliensis]